MPAYIIANTKTLENNPSFAEYRRRVQATLDPYQGRFLIRDGRPSVQEGDWHPLRITIIEFPSADSAEGWLNSPGYQEILPLRTETLESDLILVAPAAG